MERIDSGKIFEVRTYDTEPHVATNAPTYTNTKRLATCREVVGPAGVELCVEDARDDHGALHDDRAGGEHGLAAELVDQGHAGEGAGEEDAAGYASGEERECSACETQVFKDIASWLLAFSFYLPPT